MRKRVWKPEDHHEPWPRCQPMRALHPLSNLNVGRSSPVKTQLENVSSPAHGLKWVTMNDSPARDGDVRPSLKITRGTPKETNSDEGSSFFLFHVSFFFFLFCSAVDDLTGIWRSRIFSIATGVMCHAARSLYLLVWFLSPVLAFFFNAQPWLGVRALNQLDTCS